MQAEGWSFAVKVWHLVVQRRNGSPLQKEARRSQPELAHQLVINSLFPAYAYVRTPASEGPPQDSLPRVGFCFHPRRSVFLPKERNNRTQPELWWVLKCQLMPRATLGRRQGMTLTAISHKWCLEDWKIIRRARPKCAILGKGNFFYSLPNHNNMSPHNQINEKNPLLPIFLEEHWLSGDCGGLCGEGAQKKKGPSEIPSPFPDFAQSDIIQSPSTSDKECRFFTFLTKRLFPTQIPLKSWELAAKFPSYPWVKQYSTFPSLMYQTHIYSQWQKALFVSSLQTESPFSPLPC